MPLFSVPYEAHEAIEPVFLEQCLLGKTGWFTLVLRASNEIRAKLFEIATKDDRHKRSAFVLLGANRDLAFGAWKTDY